MDLQNKRITEHFRLLVASTVLSDDFLEFFITERVLGNADKLIIDAKKTTPGKVAEFYRLIQGRRRDHRVLFEALHMSGQTGPLTVLHKGMIPLNLVGIPLPAVRIPTGDEEEHQVQNQVEFAEAGGQDNQEQMEAEPASVGGGQEQGGRDDVQVVGIVQAHVMGPQNVSFAGGMMAAAGVAMVEAEGAELQRGGADEQMDEPLESTDEGHALMKEKVLANLFQYFVQQSTFGTGPEAVAAKHYQIKMLRLVCKRWRDEITPRYREILSPMVFGDASDLQLSVASFRIGAAASFYRLQAFLGLMSTSQMIPIQDYKLQGNLFVPGFENGMKDFLRLCGPEAVSIAMTVEDCLMEKYNLGSVPELNLRKLKVLEITLADSQVESIPKSPHGLGRFIELLLSGALGLDEFRFDFEQDPKQLNVRHHMMLKEIEHAIRGGLPTTVKALSLHMPLDELSFFQALIDKGIELAAFLYTTYPLMGGEVTGTFLATQAPTLKILNLAAIRSQLLEFPCMPNLEELELRDSVFIQEFDFAAKFPNVRVLDVSSWQNNLKAFAKLLSYVSTTAPAVRQIHLPNWMNLCYPEMMMEALVRRYFPNAKQHYITY